MFTAFFKAFLGISLSLSPLILLFTLVQPVLRKRYFPRLIHWIWLIFALRLLFPVPLNGGGSSLLLISSGEPVYFLEQDPSIAVRAFAEVASNGLPSTAAPLFGQDGISWMGVGAMIWLIGTAIFLLFHLVANGWMQRELYRWSVPVQSSKAVTLFKQSMRELSVTKPIRLCVCMRVPSPILVGFFRPTILLPRTDMPEQQLTSIYRHEIMHEKRHDLWYKLLLMTVLALHWYNPFVHLMVRQAEHAMELTCDDDVLRSSGISRREYGLAILSQLQPAGIKRMLLSTQFYGGKTDMKIRIQQIADTSRKRSGLPLLALCTAFITAGSLLIGCAPLSSDAFQKQVQSSSSETISSKEATFVSSAPEEEDADPELVVEEGEGLSESLGNDTDTDTLLDVQKVFERIAFDDTSQYPGGTMVWPAPKAEHITMPYGWRNDGTDFHTGVDIGGTDCYGTPVVAAQDGTIAFTNHGVGGYGKYLILNHGGGVSTLYAHLSAILVQEGQSVVKGQQIGEIGSTGDATGAILHFEVREKGKVIDPVNYLIAEEVQEDQPVLTNQTEP